MNSYEFVKSLSREFRPNYLYIIIVIFILIPKYFFLCIYFLHNKKKEMIQDPDIYTHLCSPKFDMKCAGYYYVDFERNVKKRSKNNFERTSVYVDVCYMIKC